MTVTHTQRGAIKKDFLGHLAIYVLVCTLLIVIDLATGSDGSTFLGLDWAFWPIGGWGLAVAIHGVSVLTTTTDGPVR